MDGFASAPDPTWSSVYESAFECVRQECAKLSKDAAKAGSSYAALLSAPAAKAASALLRKVFKKANNRPGLAPLDGPKVTKDMLSLLSVPGALATAAEMMARNLFWLDALRLLQELISIPAYAR